MSGVRISLVRLGYTSGLRAWCLWVKVIVQRCLCLGWSFSINRQWREMLTSSHPEVGIYNWQTYLLLSIDSNRTSDSAGDATIYPHCHQISVAEKEAQWLTSTKGGHLKRNSLEYPKGLKPRATHCKLAQLWAGGQMRQPPESCPPTACECFWV